MNTHMYQNPIVQNNLEKLKSYGLTVITPSTGMLASREEGIGKMPSENVLMDYIIREIACEKDL